MLTHVCVSHSYCITYCVLVVALSKPPNVLLIPITICCPPHSLIVKRLFLPKRDSENKWTLNAHAKFVLRQATTGVEYNRSSLLPAIDSRITKHVNN